MRIAPIIAAALLITGAQGSAAAKPLSAKQEAKIKPAGEPVTCIPITSIRTTRVRSDNVIDFYMAGRKVYRNTLPHRCPQLGFEERFTYKTSLSQLCSTDTITVLTSAGSNLSTGAGCGLGEFQPVTGAPR